MKTVAIIQARTGSVRYPQKVLQPILDMPMILRVCERVALSAVDEVVVTTTVLHEDDIIETLVSSHHYGISRGPVSNVLEQYVLAARKFKADIVVRITGDNPLIDFNVINYVLDEHRITGAEATTLYGKFPNGIDVEIFNTETLRKALTEVISARDKEHVGTYIWGHPQTFETHKVWWHIHSENMRWTVDWPEDLEFVRKIYEELYPQKHNFDTFDILRLLFYKPYLRKINYKYPRNVGFACS